MRIVVGLLFAVSSMGCAAGQMGSGGASDTTAEDPRPGARFGLEQTRAPRIRDASALMEQGQWVYTMGHVRDVQDASESAAADSLQRPGRQ